MPRIIINQSTLVGRRLAGLTLQVIDLAENSNRLKAIADQITNNGVNKALLESSNEALIPAGQGTVIYDGIESIRAAAASLSALVSAIDQG